MKARRQMNNNARGRKKQQKKESDREKKGMFTWTRGGGRAFNTKEEEDKKTLAPEAMRDNLVTAGEERQQEGLAEKCLYPEGKGKTLCLKAAAELGENINRRKPKQGVGQEEKIMWGEKKSSEVGGK